MKHSSTVLSPAPSSGSAFGSEEKKAVARMAFELWQQYGCPSGRDELIWLEAERAVGRSSTRKTAKPARESVDVEDVSGLRNLDLITLPGDGRDRSPTSIP